LCIISYCFISVNYDNDGSSSVVCIKEDAENSKNCCKIRFPTTLYAAHKMSINIPSTILTLKGQRVNQVQFDEDNKKPIIRCERDKRRAAIDPVTGQKGRINRLIKRQVRDAPVFGQSCLIEIERAQVFINKKINIRLNLPPDRRVTFPYIWFSYRHPFRAWF
jgi:hypothetical protein